MIVAAVVGFVVGHPSGRERQVDGRGSKCRRLLCQASEAVEKLYEEQVMEAVSGVVMGSK